MINAKLNIKSTVKNYNNNKKFYHDTFKLYAVRIFDLGIGFACNMFIAKHLQQSQFGVYSFIFNFIFFTSLFFDFGFFTAISRILAITRPEFQQNKLNLFIKRLFLLMSALSVFIFISSFFVDSIFKVTVEETLRLISIIAGAALFNSFFANITAGTSEIKKMILFSLLWRSTFAIALLSIYFLGWFNITNILLLYFGLQFVFFFALHYQEFFGSTKLEDKTELQKSIRTYGFDIYISRLIDTASFKTDSLFITYYKSSDSLGPYAIAQSFGSPVGVLGNSVATMFFKDFATQAKISKKILLKNFVAALFFAIVCFALGLVCFKYYLKFDYANFPILLATMISVSLFEAAFAPFNMWFVAQGLSKEIRIKTYTTACANLLLNLILIKQYAELGAALASIISVALSFVIYVYLYKQKISKT